jgi:hypothetical protein
VKLSANMFLNLYRLSSCPSGEISHVYTLAKGLV